MPWITFTDDFDFSPAAKGGRVTTAYKRGMTMNVTRECAELAIAKAKAKRAASARRSKGKSQQAGAGSDENQQAD